MSLNMKYLRFVKGQRTNNWRHLWEPRHVRSGSYIWTLRFAFPSIALRSLDTIYRVSSVELRTNNLSSFPNPERWSLPIVHDPGLHWSTPRHFIIIHLIMSSSNQDPSWDDPRLTVFIIWGVFIFVVFFCIPSKRIVQRICRRIAIRCCGYEEESSRVADNGNGWVMSHHIALHYLVLICNCIGWTIFYVSCHPELNTPLISLYTLLQ